MIKVTEKRIEEIKAIAREQIAIHGIDYIQRWYTFIIKYDDMQDYQSAVICKEIADEYGYTIDTDAKFEDVWEGKLNVKFEKDES